MTFEDIDIETLGYAVAEISKGKPQFRTKEVSQHPVMQAAHQAVLGEGHYHSVVGKLLRQNCERFGIKLIEDSRTDDGHLWEQISLSS